MKLKQLDHASYHNVRTLFDKDYPNLAFVYGIIEGSLPGEVWVDQHEKPSVCLITSRSPYCFISGLLNPTIFAEFYNILKTKDNVKLVCEEQSHENLINFSSYGFQSVARVQYRFRDINSQAVKSYENNTRYVLCPITEKSILDSCLWKNLVVSIFGSSNNYLEKGAGFVLQDPKDQQVASESHGVIGGDLIEIGTITHHDHQSRGLSTIVCNELIRSAIKKGLHPIWTCDQANTPSNRVAQHQGMDEVKPYTFYCLSNKK